MVEKKTENTLAPPPAAVLAREIDDFTAAGDAIALLKFLPERYTGYTGRNSNEIVRIKGYAFAAFIKTGLPEQALPFVLDELENGMDAYLVAGAAIALRGLAHPDPVITPYLLKAFYNMLFMDDAVSFQSFTIRYPLATYTTPLTEILKTIQCLQSKDNHLVNKLKKFSIVHHDQLSKSVRNLILETIEIMKQVANVDASCCDIPQNSPAHIFIHQKRIRKEVQLEDQESQLLSYKDFFTGKFTVVIFFYTRCDNPNKCSLSVSRFTQLQQLLEERGITNIRLAGITYDAAYDAPSRLKSFGLNRGFNFNTEQRFFRVISGYDTFKSYLNLGVNYVGSVVNNHAIELYILDKNGQVKMAQTRLQWSPEEIINTLQSFKTYNVSFSFRKVLRITGNTLTGLLIAFFPKCPVCWAGYMSIFGVIGLQSTPYTPQLFYIILIGMALNLYINYRVSRKKGMIKIFYIHALGCFLVISGYIWEFQIAIYGGIILLLISSIYINISSIFHPGRQIGSEMVSSDKP